MAKIKPFKAIRPVKELADKVSTLPYDVFSEKESRDIVKNNPDSFLRIVRPETVFPEGTNIYGPEVYEKAKEMLEESIEKGVLIQDQTDSYYIYREIMNGRSQTGLVACFSVDDYLNDVIKKHEYTRPEKETDRTRHIDVCSAQTGLVFLSFPGADEVKRIIEEKTSGQPLFDFISADGVHQLVWKVDDPEMVKTITEYFADIPYLYIADGHHRCASAASVCLKRRKENEGYDGSEDFNYILAVAFPQDQLLIYPYNRVVRDLNGMTPEQFIEALKGAGFEVSPVSKEFTEKEKQLGSYHPKKKGEFAMYLDKKWYRVTAKQEILKTDAVGSLDVSLLQENVLDKILGIKDPRTDKRIDFIGGIRGFGELEKRCSEDAVLAFGMYPTSMDELVRVAAEGKVMPPKSTWFEPKLQSGLFVHKI